MIDEAGTTVWSANMVHDEGAILDAVSGVLARAEDLVRRRDATSPGPNSTSQQPSATSAACTPLRSASPERSGAIAEPRPSPAKRNSLASRSSRQLAAAQRAAMTSLGGRAVSLADVVGPFFLAQPDAMFSLDRFHPSSAGYKRTAKALLPSVLAALGYEERVPFGHHGPG